MAVTLQDIANNTGLSVSTVSRALSTEKSPHAGEQTRRKVFAAAAKLGYRPNVSARALARGRSDNVALLLPELDCIPYIHQIETHLDELGLHVTPFASHWQTEREAELLESLPARMLDAVINLHYLAANKDVYQEHRRRGQRLIFRVVEEDIEDVPFDCIGVDVDKGVRVLIEHLHAQGYRRIGLLGGFGATDVAAGRFDRGHARGYMQGHQAVGMPVETGRAVPCGAGMVEAYEAARKALASGRDDFDAFIVQSPDKLTGVIKAVQDAGLTIGRDMGLATIGAEDEPVCSLYDVTTWAQPVYRVCKGLVSLLKNRLDDPEGPIHKIYYESTLVARSSSSRG
ncbi:MAG: LacI family transcriptional regulator [Planctomycetes bacterium]|nr:LacI family transcriptional regulator [Planctomycetota bacterium]